ncbi:replication protein RepA [Acidisphaera sp. L21]|jgi:hypothetical protein|uniref:replication protein RepA n=1 Tax=Acidisphaera sp. L21 TaxID=1641851 RepID=UPI00131BA7A7|nr:replication protein RepA [Acidisphaera sp. L21]
MGEVHKLLELYGKPKVLQMDLDRQIVDAAAGYMGSEDGEVGYLYSGWAQSSLPHKRIADDAVWQVRTDHVSLMVQPGFRPTATGDAIPVGVPYGSRARLIFLYLQSEALKSNSREVPLGKSLHAWLKRLDISVGGTSMAAVRDQAERISRCRMSFQIKQGSRTGLVNQNVLDASMFVEDDSAQGALFIETAKLSELFFDQLKRHPVPVEESAVKQIANNSLAIDVYCWLAYRLHSLSEPKLVTWKSLHLQFGRGSRRMDHFRAYFRKVLELSMAVYPGAQVATDERGVTLMPSRPPVSARSTLSTTRKLRA